MLQAHDRRSATPEVQQGASTRERIVQLAGDRPPRAGRRSRATTSRSTSCRATRPNEPGASDFVRHWLSWGAGPRAGQYLILAGKARASMHGRLYVTIEDIEAVAAPVLRHRLVPNFNAEAEGITVEQIIEKILTLIPRGKGERLL